MSQPVKKEPVKKGISFSPLARSFSGTTVAPLAGNEKRFGNGKQAFGSGTPYPKNKQFYGQPKSAFWQTSQEKAAAAAAAAAGQEGGRKIRRKTRKNRKSKLKKTRKH
jgi:hypothetical protein